VSDGAGQAHHRVAAVLPTESDTYRAGDPGCSGVQDRRGDFIGVGQHPMWVPGTTMGCTPILAADSATGRGIARSSSAVM
jgi:hypothetical protein